MALHDRRKEKDAWDIYIKPHPDQGLVQVRESLSDLSEAFLPGGVPDGKLPSALRGLLAVLHQVFE